MGKKVKEGGGGGIAAVAAKYTADTRLKIEARAGRGTPEERAEAERIIARAKAATEYGVDITTMTSGLAALLFVNAPMHNRDWAAAKSVQFADQIGKGEWRPNGNCLQFYLGGTVADYQHRLGGIALADTYTGPQGIVYGMERDAKYGIDSGGKIRTAADAAKMDGQSAAKPKEAMVRTVASYLKKREGEIIIPTASTTQIVASMKQYDGLLTEALDIAAKSTVGISQPVLKDAQADAVAFLCLFYNWPADVVLKKLYRLQTGNVPEGGSEKDPLFLAGDLIVTMREKQKGKDMLRTQGEIAIALKGLILSESGVVASKTADLKSAIKELPEPQYPSAKREAA